jgi:hypothetical protein
MKLATRTRITRSLFSLGVTAASFAASIDAHAVDIVASHTVSPATIRAIAPSSMGVVTSARPTLRWSSAPTANHTHVEICADRSCGRVLASIDARGTEARPNADLAAGTYYWRLTPMRDATPIAPATAAWAFTVRARAAATDTTIGFRADLDGDGHVDAVHGVTLSGERGRAVIQFGARREPFVLRANDADSSFGDAAAMAGDIDGDGYGDVVIGAPSYARDAGRLYVYFGAHGGLAPRVRTIDAPAGGGRFGWSVSAAGDVDADGYGDVIVGAYDFAGGAGRAYVYRGSASGLDATPSFVLEGDGSLGNFGVSVASAGDIDADGYADVVVGADLANARAGRAYVFRGGASGTNATPAATLDGFVARGDFGIAVAGGFDFDADGYGDIAIGAHVHGGAGRAHVFFGSPRGVVPNQAVSFVPDPGEREFGIMLTAAGDVDDDGFDDLRVGFVHGDEWIEGERLVRGAARSRQFASAPR